jgi:hypothetical protein
VWWRWLPRHRRMATDPARHPPQPYAGHDARAIRLPGHRAASPLVGRLERDLDVVADSRCAKPHEFGGGVVPGHCGNARVQGLSGVTRLPSSWISGTVTGWPCSVNVISPVVSPGRS